MTGKSLAAVGIVLAFRHPLATAMTIAEGLAQIGEFSFIPVSLGLSLKLLPEDARNLLLGGALLSITLNPLFFALAARIEQVVADRWTGPRGPLRPQGRGRCDGLRCGDAKTRHHPDRDAADMS
ncbi:hypothetical protein CIW48_18925 [Methylobacterium sp. P1-11]|nr:hypothetical protein CIW48_18925 [Methylobacterium sp. P1-11]